LVKEEKKISLRSRGKNEGQGGRFQGVGKERGKRFADYRVNTDKLFPKDLRPRGRGGKKERGRAAESLPKQKEAGGERWWPEIVLGREG